MKRIDAGYWILDVELGSIITDINIKIINK